MTIEEMEEAVSTALHLADEVRAIQHLDGPRTELEYKLAWVRTYLKKLNALENSERGVWHLTSIGADLSEAEIAGIPKRVRELDRSRRAQRNVEDISETDGAIELSWKDRLLNALLSMKPDGFERLCQRILRESGFTKVEVTGRSGDGGIDGTGVLRLNLLSFHVLFQSKRFRGSVGAPVIRDFRGAMVGRADKGLIITTGTFTPEARREATRDGAPAIDLVDGDGLCELLKQLRVGVSVRLVEEVEVEDAHFSTI